MIDPTCWDDGDGKCPECGEYAVFHRHPAFRKVTFVECVEGDCGEFELNEEGERIVRPPAEVMAYATPGCLPAGDDFGDEPF